MHAQTNASSFILLSSLLASIILSVKPRGEGKTMTLKQEGQLRDDCERIDALKKFLKDDHFSDFEKKTYRVKLPELLIKFKQRWGEPYGSETNQ